MRCIGISAVVTAIALAGCNTGGKPFIALGPTQAPAPQPVVAAAATTTSAATVVTSDAAPATVPTAPITAPSTPATVQPSPLAQASPPPAPGGPVATSALGTVRKVPDVTPKPKPFIALPKPAPVFAARPSTLLLEHAVADSPVPLSEFANQPVHSVGDFHLRAELSAAEVQRALGPPAQLADNDDPWFVYRLNFGRELWLHFTGPLLDHLDAADVIRGAEDGYVRDRVFGE